MVIHVISSPDLPFFLTRWPLGDRNVILKMQFSILIYIGIFKSSYDNVLRWMPQNLTGDKSTLVQVMAWCHQATSHYLNQCWPRSLTPYGVTRPQWVKVMSHEHYGVSNHQQLSCLPTACSDWQQRNHPCSVFWPFVRRIYQTLVDSSHKGTAMWKMFPFHDVMMCQTAYSGT